MIDSVIDLESRSSILSVPWMRDSVIPTTNKWGTNVVDVSITGLPKHIVSQVVMNHLNKEEVTLIMYAYSRYSTNWDNGFEACLTFPCGDVYALQIPPSCKLIDSHSIPVPIKLTTEIREKLLQTDRTIPRILFNLTAPLIKQVSEDVRQLLKRIRKINSIFQYTSLYLVLQDDACLKEVESSNIPNFEEAYKSLRAPSYKADLMRYYLLYRYGGIYCDDKTLIRESIDSHTFDNILKDCDFFIGINFYPEIAFMGSRPGSPIMLKCLTSAIDNIMKREYGRHRLSITGNYMIFDILRDDINMSYVDSKELIKRITSHGERCVFLPIAASNNGVLLDGKFLWERQAIPNCDWPKPLHYYTTLWAQGRVYLDDNPATSTWGSLTSSEKGKLIFEIISAVIIITLIGFAISLYPPISWI